MANLFSPQFMSTPMPLMPPGQIGIGAPVMPPQQTQAPVMPQGTGFMSDPRMRALMFAAGQSLASGNPSNFGSTLQSMNRQRGTPGKTPIYGKTKDGKTGIGIIDESGNFKLLDTGGFEVGEGVDKIDAGTHFNLYSKRTGQMIGTVPKENRQEAFDTELGKVEGKREGELPVLRSKAQSALQDLNRQHGIVKDEISQAITMMRSSPRLTTGIVGGISDAVPGTPAYQLAQKLKTIKANVGFDKLQTMRENSPTGGALGQVSDFENRQLQAVMGALDQAQDADTIIYNLMRLQALLEGGEQSRSDAFNRDFGAVATPEFTTPPQAGGQQNDGVIDWQEYFR